MKEKEVVFSQNKFYLIYLVGFFLILFLPLWTYPPLFHPPDFAKSIVFRIVFSFILFLFGGQILFQKDVLKIVRDKIPRGRSGLVFWLLIALLAVSILSTIFSAEPDFSFWGSPYRGGGSLTYLFLILFSLLIFLILRQKDWQKFWFFSIIIGLLVSLIGIFQHFKILSQFFIPSPTKVPATMGSPSLLGVYLLLLTFTTLAFGFKEKRVKNKIFYFLSFLIFLFVIFLTGSQAAYFGFGLGLIYFLLFYPKRPVSQFVDETKARIYFKRLFIFKFFITFFVVLGLIAVIFTTYYLKNNPDSPFNKNFLIRSLFYWRMDESRISAWKVSLNALKERPLPGFGPENFSIPFDKYYDPSLPGIDRQPGGAVTGWWDRAHNILFEISLTYGILALICYLLIFAILFLQLEKVKRNRPEKALISNGIQATFLGYLAALFFGFDGFSSYLVFFFLISYSLHLIAETNADVNAELTLKSAKNQRTNQRNFGGESLATRIFSPITGLKTLIFGLTLIILVWFIWFYNLKPLLINNDINWAEWYSNNKKCAKAVEKMEKVLPSKSILDNYLRLQYINVIKECMKEYPDQKPVFALKGIELLEEAIDSRPTYTRTWLFLGTFNNIFVEYSQNLDPEIKAQSLWAADNYFQKAYELNPKRQEIFVGWVKTDLLAREYQKAKEKAQVCIDLNPKLPDCWWGKGLALLYLEDYEEAAKNMEIAAQKGYNIDSKEALSQLLQVYLKMETPEKDKSFYQKLADIYQRIIEYEPNNFQHHASLAYVYKTLGDYQKAVEEAVKVFVISPESKINIEEFLNSIPNVSNYYQFVAENFKILIADSPTKPGYHLGLAFVYKMMGEYQKAREETLIALELSIVSGLSPEWQKNVEEFLKTLP